MNSKNGDKSFEICLFDSKEKKADGRKRQRETDDGNAPKKTRAPKGKWTRERRLALMKNYLLYRPHGVPYNKRTGQWLKITQEVNSVSAYEPGVSKKSVAEKFYELIEIHRPLFKEYEISQQSGSNWVSHPEVYAAYNAWYQMEKDKALCAQEKSKTLDGLEEMQERHTHLEAMSICGREICENKERRKGKERETEASSPTENIETASQSFNTLDIDDTASIMRQPPELRQSEQSVVLTALEQLHEDNVTLNKNIERVLSVLAQILKK